MNDLNSIGDLAFKWVKNSRLEIIKKFCDRSIYPSYDKPTLLFMAGAPGAGKTEYSKSLVRELEERDPLGKYVRVDADEIRKIIPQFSGKNSSEVQRAASKGVSIVMDHVFDKKQNAVVDGTFANYSIMHQNVERSLKRTDKVGIFYLFQEPLLAWEFTQAREKIEGRNISKEVFIDAFLKARENVDLIKSNYGSKIDLNLIVQNRDNGLKKIYFNIDRVDNHSKKSYTMGSLKEILK